MSRRNPSLEGGDKFDGSHGNPVTEKQSTIITLIETHTPYKFTGHTSKNAYDFIHKYYPYVPEEYKTTNHFGNNKASKQFTNGFIPCPQVAPTIIPFK